MKTVYTAIPLALLAAIAQAESQAQGPTDIGHDFMGESTDKGDVVGDTFDHDFLGNGFDHPKQGATEPAVDNDVSAGAPNSDVGFASSPVNSPASNGPHNFNQQDGPDTESGHNEVDGGINNDNIVINPVNNQQQSQGVESDPHVAYPPPPPPHGGPPPVEHQPEQLPPQQHSEPKKATDLPPPEYQPHPEAAPKPEVPHEDAPGPVSAPKPPTVPQPDYEPHSQADPEPKETPANAKIPASPEKQQEEPPCPPSADGTHHMPDGGDHGESQHETSDEHQAPPSPKGNPYQPPQPSYVPQPYPLPHHDAPKPDYEDHDDFPGSHGTYPQPDGLETFPHSGDSEPVHPLPVTPSHQGSESEASNPSPPVREYGNQHSQAYVPGAHVTPHPASSRAKASAAPSSVRYASYHALAVPSDVHTPSCSSKWATLPTPARTTSQASTPTGHGPSSTPAPFLGGAGFNAAPGGFTLAVLGALAFIL